MDRLSIQIMPANVSTSPEKCVRATEASAKNSMPTTGHKPASGQQLNNLLTNTYQKREVRIHKTVGKSFGICISHIGEGYYITALDAGSTAWNAGLDIGDRIDMVNDLYVYQTKVPASKLLQEIVSSSIVEISICDAPVVHNLHVRRSRNNQPLGFKYTDLRIGSIEEGSALDFAIKSSGVKITNCSILSINGNKVVGLPDNQVAQIAERYYRFNDCLDISVVPHVFMKEVMFMRSFR